MRGVKRRNICSLILDNVMVKDCANAHRKKTKHLFSNTR